MFCFRFFFFFFFLLRTLHKWILYHKRLDDVGPLAFSFISSIIWWYSNSKLSVLVSWFHDRQSSQQRWDLNFIHSVSEIITKQKTKTKKNPSKHFYLSLLSLNRLHTYHGILTWLMWFLADQLEPSSMLHPH